MSEFVNGGGFMTFCGQTYKVTSWSAKVRSTPLAEMRGVLSDRADCFEVEYTFNVEWHDPGAARCWISDALDMLRRKPYVHRPRSLVNWLFPERN